jgi:hypothetical protein
VNPIPKSPVNYEGEFALFEVHISRLSRLFGSARGTLRQMDLHGMSKAGRVREKDGPQRHDEEHG